MFQETPLPQEAFKPPEDDLARYERVLAEHIFPQLERGRPNYDRPHTISVVQKAKDIFSNTTSLHADPVVVVIAAYAHDWGYADLYRDGQPLPGLSRREEKRQHMEIGATKLEQLLQEEAFNALTLEQKARAVHLVSVHDNVEDLTADDEKLIMEADTLGALDVSYLEPTMSPDENTGYLQRTRDRRKSHFLTEYSKDRFEVLIEGRKQWYADHYEKNRKNPSK